jgi:hypothetical protein
MALRWRAKRRVNKGDNSHQKKVKVLYQTPAAAYKCNSDTNRNLLQTQQPGEEFFYFQ